MGTLLKWTLSDTQPRALVHRYTSTKTKTKANYDLTLPLRLAYTHVSGGPDLVSKFITMTRGRRYKRAHVVIQYFVEYFYMSCGGHTFFARKPGHVCHAHEYGPTVVCQSTHISMRFMPLPSKVSHFQWQL